MIKCNIGTAALAGTAVLFPALLGAAEKQRPNFLIILSDDAGYGDFGFTGSEEFQTPNLDKLASDAVFFDRAYVTCPVSGPSRAGLLTGQYQQRYGFVHNNVPGACDLSASVAPENMGLDTSAVTIGNRFQNLGYTTIALGKWHQGYNMQFHPNNRGFDEFFGFLGGQRSYFPMDDPETEFKMWQNMEVLGEREGYYTDMLGERACRYIEQMASEEKPFLMYLAFNAVHTPLHAKPEDLERFSHLKGSRRSLAAMAWAMDEAIGRVLVTLKESGQYENTVIVFLNDNGGPRDVGTDNGKFSGSKATLLEGGIRVPFLMRIPDGILTEKPSVYRNAISTMDILPTFMSMAGADLPDGLDGVDLLPYLSNPESKPHELLFWYFDGDFKGCMKGDWKLIVMPDRPAELYNVSEDIAERSNMAAAYPEMVKEMYGILSEWMLTMERPKWQLLPKYTKNACEKYDKYRK